MLSRSKLGLLIAFGAGAGLPPLPMTAQTVPSPYAFLESRQEAGLFAGVMAPGTGRFGFGPGEGPAWGARYGIDISGPFGLEAVATHFPTQRDIIDPGRVEGDMVVGDMPTRVVMIDGRLRFSLTGDRAWHGLSPFVFTGGGVAFDVAGDNSDEELILSDDRFKFSTTFVGLMGSGIRWFPSERFLVRGDLSLFLWRLKTPRGFRDPERAFEGVGEKEWASGPSFSLGIGYRF